MSKGPVLLRPPPVPSMLTYLSPQCLSLREETENPFRDVNDVVGTSRHPRSPLSGHETRDPSQDPSSSGVSLFSRSVYRYWSQNLSGCYTTPYPRRLTEAGRRTVPFHPCHQPGLPVRSVLLPGLVDTPSYRHHIHPSTYRPLVDAPSSPKSLPINGRITSLDVPRLLGYLPPYLFTLRNTENTILQDVPVGFHQRRGTVTEDRGSVNSAQKKW